MHTKPVSHIGGVAIVLSMWPLIICVLFLTNTIGDAYRDVLPELLAMLSAAVGVFCLGLIDDIKTKGLPARTKFVAEFVAAVVVCAAGIRIRSLVVADQWTLEFGWFSWPLTLFWIVGITNAVNLSDGLDGLATGIAAITCAVIAVLAIQSGQVVMAVLMLALIGSLSGFLVFNFNPARVFMGDCGSLFIGFTIASASVMCAAKSAAFIGLALPALALGIPIFDTLFSILRRFLERRSLFAPDRRHFHHKLIDLGLTQRHAVISIYVMTLLAVGLGMFMMIVRDGSSLIIFFCILLLLLLGFNVVGSVRLKDTVTGLQRKYAMSRQMQEETKSFEEAQLYFRNVSTSEQWRAAVCEAAKRLDFAWVSLTTIDKGETVQTQVWRLADAPQDLSKVAILTIPFNGNGSEMRHEFEIAIRVNGSYESASRRATLFSRLIDEHHVASLLH